MRAVHREPKTQRARKASIAAASTTVTSASIRSTSRESGMRLVMGVSGRVAGGTARREIAECFRHGRANHVALARHRRRLVALQ
jgi:hypothetical protein